MFKQEIERESGREFSKELLEDAWKRVDFTYEPLQSTVKKQALAAYRAGFLKKEPDLSLLFDTQLLKQLESGKVETHPEK